MHWDADSSQPQQKAQVHALQDLDLDLDDDDTFTKLHQVRPTYHWFRNHQKPAKEVREQNLLEPFRFTPALPVTHFVACLEDMISANADRIFFAIQSMSGVVKPTTTTARCRESLLETGLLDFPHLFDWFFSTPPNRQQSVAEMGINEAAMMFHHTKATAREQVLATS
jgi:hypothetical protein